MFSTAKSGYIVNQRTYVPTLYVDDFVGKEVLVMYNPTKNKVFVLDFAENYSLPTNTL